MEVGPAIRGIEAANRCERVYAVFGFPVLGADRVEIDPVRGLEAPARLRLPATGRVTIVVDDADGKPHRERLRVRVDATLPGLVGRPSGLVVPWEGIAHGGRCEVPFVGPGLDLICSAEDPAGAFASASRRAAGPRAGDTTTVRLSMGTRMPVIRGRLLRADTVVAAILGLPPGPSGSAGEEEEEAYEDGPEASAHRAATPVAVTIDSQGEFTFPWRWRREPAAGRSLLFAEAISSEGEPLGRSLEIDFSAAVPDEGVDVGDVELGTGSLLLSGKVVDERGEPVDGARVRVEDASYRPARRRPLATVVTDGRGRFLAFGEEFAGEVRVTASAEDHMQGQVGRVSAGSEAVVVARRTGALAGRVKVDRVTQIWALRIAAAPADEATPRGRPARLGAGSRSLVTAASGGIGRDGTFVLKGLAPGRASVRFLIDAVEILRVDDLEVRGGATSAPEALAAVALPALPRDVRIRCVDPGGRALAGRRAFHERIVDSRGDGARGVDLDDQGAAVLNVAPEATSLRVAVEGFLPERIEIGSRNAIEVVCRPGPRVDLVLEGLPVRDGFEHEAVLIHDPDRTERKELPTLPPLDLFYVRRVTSESTRFELSHPGPYRVGIRETSLESGASHMLRLETSGAPRSLAEIRVARGSEPRRFVINVEGRER